MRSLFAVCLLLGAILLVGAPAAHAQGVTTAAISGIVLDTNARPILGATVTAVHLPSGTTYGTLTRADGRFLIPGMRVGGPYRVTASHLGYERQLQDNISLSLGVATPLEFSLREAAIAVEGVTVTGRSDAVFSAERTGAATSVERDVLARLPTISGRIEDFARLTPQYKGTAFGFSFAGQDNRLNNVTIDGAYFNNSFGLAGQPGDRTNVAPISLSAIEQVQINVAPFDVRQGNFVGAGVNTVTRSGTNSLRGELYYQFRDQDWVGTEAKALPVDPGTFTFRNMGGWVSGPIIQNRLFFFTSLESDELNQPGTTFRARTSDAETPQGSITRVMAAEMDQLGSFLRTSFGYDPGGYQGYQFSTPATRFLGKLDFNLNDRNKLSLRYSQLDSDSDILVSNSGSLGGPANPAARRSNTNGLNFQNSNYKILENIRSIVGEWNSVLGPNLSNNLIIGYSTHDESRQSPGELFPFVDINRDGSVFTSFGTEPFTPNNELRYNSLQFQNNFTRHGTRHDLTFGVSAERYRSENVFFPGSQSVYVYNSLEDFYADANNHLANPNRTTSPVTLRRFQVRWMNIPGLEKPIQPLEVLYAGVYGQNQWRATDNLRLTFGLRLDVPFFNETGYQNANADQLTFRDEDGNPVRYGTAQLPEANVLYSPRFGFNWDVMGDRTTQVRGGSGIFTARPAYVWISNQIGNTGVLTGFQQLDNTTARPFNPNPHHYKPTSVDGSPATSYSLELTDPNFRFPQLWRNNIAVDQRLPFGLIGTAEYLYNRDVNGLYYINANLPEAQSRFVGADDRPRWTGPSCTGNPPVSPCVNRINNVGGNQVSTAVVLKNQNVGRSWNLAGSLEKPFSAGSYLKAGYSYGEARNTVDPGSIATGSWSGNAHAGDPNNPGLGYSINSPGHRYFLAGSYRREYFRFGATTLSLFVDAFTLGNGSYTFAGDLNGDGAGNDLIYIHRDISEMNFQQYTQTFSDGRPSVTFTAQQQAEAWNAYIEQDSYLRKNRGSYAQRGAVFLPMVRRADLSISQEVFRDLVGRRNALQIRADFLNLGNLLNKDWGVGQRLVHNQPLIVPTVAQGGAADNEGRAQYRLRNINGELMSTSFQQTTLLNDVYRVQLSVRYLFN
jgi:hypothetical protein